MWREGEGRAETGGRGGTGAQPRPLGAVRRAAAIRGAWPTGLLAAGLALPLPFHRLEGQAPSAAYRAERDPGFAVRPDLELTDPAALVAGSDRRVYVADRWPSILYRLSPDGRVVERSVTPGAGPGEAQGFSAIGWIGDTLWIMDPALQRLTFLSRGERFVRTEPYRDRCPLRAPWTLLQDGRCLTGIVGPDHRPGDAIPVVTVAAGGRGVDTLFLWSTAHQSMRFDLTNGRSSVRQPFSDEPAVAVSPLGTLVAVVERAAARSARPATFRVRMWSPARGWFAEREFPYRPRPLEERVVDSTVRAIEAGLARMSPGIPIGRDSLRRALYRPAYYPPVAEVRLGRDSTLWLRLAAEPPRPLAAARVLWLVLDWTGAPLRTVEAPAGLRIYDASGDLLWGVERDADEVPSVVRYRVVRE